MEKAPTFLNDNKSEIDSRRIIQNLNLELGNKYLTLSTFVHSGKLLQCILTYIVSVVKWT